MDKSYRLTEFNVYDATAPQNENEEWTERRDNKEFLVQMFGINEKGKTCSIFVEGFLPFFYVKVGDDWDDSTKQGFIGHLNQKLGKYWNTSIVSSKLINRKKLYGFDGGKMHTFLLIRFKNTRVLYKAKNLWYDERKTQEGIKRKLMPHGYRYNDEYLELYEANIPPLLRLFHIQNISPSGWITLPLKKTLVHKSSARTTTCNYEYTINYKHIIPLPKKETRVPYKICSFDIEASSSHGDFPLPIKSYKKLAVNMVDVWKDKEEIGISDRELLKKIVKSAYGYDECYGVDKVYSKVPLLEAEVERRLNSWLDIHPGQLQNILQEDDDEPDDEEEGNNSFWKPTNFNKSYKNKKSTVIDILNDGKCTREIKIQEINKALCQIFPPLEGDKVTFIGSTFLKYGDDKPYLNHCAVLNTCSKPKNVENCVIDTYDTEKEVLIAWKDLIQKENPDIIIGYNIFGFDYEFMFKRALELGCLDIFLQLSRNKGEVCANRDWQTQKLKLEENSIVIASGQHDIRFIKMNGRLQVDMYNYFRRDYNLVSYKLDHVSGHFIGDGVKKLDHINGKTCIHSKNLTGLENGSYINFEESSHSSDMYKDGQKFMVENMNFDEGTFVIDGIETPNMEKYVRWGLAKDDVTPQDIFRLTNEGPNERAIIAKYCIQDCNLVHHLLRKIDVLTGYIEMSTLCSVPMNFLVMRGQGIKLTSYIAKKCSEKKTLLPVMEKPDNADGYEGAIVLPPKCNLYLDKPVACVDYSSLYPSSMISENISHDSKVWTKEYDLDGKLVIEIGETDKNGNYIYDNLPEYTYVNITYDTFQYVRKTPKAAVKKICKGWKICRFAQFPDGKACMPSILEELLAARKATRKLIPSEKNDFMKNVLDKRQLSIKVTANSLYGQTGAKTSSFYEVDVAASTTATGRKLLTYAQRVIEETYADQIITTKNYGQMRTKAEYIYGDTDSVFFTFNLEDMQGNPIRGKKALEITIDLAQEAGELATKFLKKPHDLEYEKTFMPFCLLSKKRYVGMLYEKDPNKCQRKSMGIVLKRRDNAPIVKDIYGGVIDILMKEQNIEKAIEFLKQSLQNIVDEKCTMDKLIITKSLRSNYKNPAQIAHKVLADRIGKRDPGSKPSPGDRIPFAYIQTKNKKALQGEKIELPSYIKENGLKIDYSFYISNQIMKPVQQIFALVLEEMPEFKKKYARYERTVRMLQRKHNGDEEKMQDKIQDLRNKEVKVLLFDSYLRKTENAKKGNVAITNFFGNV